MCGIVGYAGDKQAVPVLLDGLSKLEYRGYDSAGIAVFEKNAIKVEKCKGRLKNLIDKIDEKGMPSSHVGIGHTRWATHGEPSDINSHPHGNKRVTIVHNGIIENYKKIKDFLISEGYSFVSETDTETVAKLIDYYYNGDPIETISRVISEIKGSYALGIMFRDLPDRIYAVRKDSPLIVGLSSDENFMASDVPAIISYTRDYYLLEQNEIAEIRADRVKVFDRRGNIIEKEMQRADWDVDAAEKGGFEHFMLKEIYEQPSAVNMTITPRIIDGLPDFSMDGLDALELKKYDHIHIVACGTAVHAGMVGKYVMEKLSRVPVTVEIASEFRYRDPLVEKDDLVILISQSGETADTKAALELAKSRGAKTVAVVNVKGSSIARDADTVIYTHAGPEISVASTKAYMVQVSIMMLLAFELAYVKGKIDKEHCKRYVNELKRMSEAINEAIELREKCQYAASRLIISDSLLYIGRGLDYALSMEGSLKLKEISYIHSESYAAGELKHGTISLITEGMPVIAVATQKELIEKTVSNIKEVKSRGAYVILICDSSVDIEDGVADQIIRLPEADQLLMPMVAAVPLQLIAYYTAVLKGCDVDKPRNLAKSVTVE
ncbi:MAG: glutamine--fructose-6-phosphate transaminase (isomerizing) [Lachnospiraceae bacterium]|nr:glutamine--fructose-6-phosphate transaminase (isomerizing) [Lachnospiraceae bacterium]